MDVNYNNFLTINEILADVTVGMDDEDTRKLTPGFYKAQVKYALDELGFDTFFLKQTEDIDIPDNLRIDVPEGCYNLEFIKAFTGTPEDFTSQVNVYWKRNFQQTAGGWTGVYAYGNHNDPFVRAISQNQARYFFNVQNGVIHLSDLCADFDFIKVTYSGIPSKNIANVKMVPPEVRKAVVLWVTEKCASYLKIKDNHYRIIQLDAASQLDEYGMRGAWHEAKTRLRQLDTKQMQDILTYNAQMNY